MTPISAQGAAASAAASRPLRSQWVSALARTGVVALAGAVSGLLALGAGSRVSMRLVALSSGKIGSGTRPESGANPGEITLDGTMFLLLAGTFAGIVFAVIVTGLLSRWLPEAGWRRTAVVVSLASVAPGMVLVDPSNPDFALFGPAAVAVPLFAACALGYGLMVAVLTERWRVPGRPQSIVLPEGRPRWWFGDRVQLLGEGLVRAAAIVSLGLLGVRGWQILSGAGSL